MSFHRAALAAAASTLALASGAAMADAISVNFESFATAPLPGGADTRAPGNGNQWWVPGNSATYGVVKAGIGRAGSQGLEVGNRGIPANNGVIHNVTSGRLNQAAGESSVAPLSMFTSSFWFRTASETAVSGFTFKTESWGGQAPQSDRTTWLGFTANSSGSLTVESVGYDAGGAFAYQAAGATLNFGDWYRVVTEIVFSDGAANDVVTYSVYDDANALVLQLTDESWEQGQRVHGFNGGQQVAVDAIGFQSRNSVAGINGAVYIDDVQWASTGVPEPGTIALVLGAALAGGVVSRRRKRG